jgi:hypothetical protein
MSQNQIKALNQRVTELEEQLKASQQQIVNTCAQQLDRLFTNPIMVDTLAHRFFVAAANAIAHKASQAQDRAPELTVLEGYIPGALRAILNEDGSMTVEQQLKGAVNAGGTWESANDQYEEHGILDQFAQLMAAYGAQAGRVYYITDTVTAAAHRDKLAREMAATVSPVADGEDPVADEYPADIAPAASSIVVELKLAADFDQITSSIYDEEHVVTIRRGTETLTLNAGDLQEEDVITLGEDEFSADWIVTGTSLLGDPELPSIEAEGEVEVGTEAPDAVAPEVAVADPAPEVTEFGENTQVRLVLKPWNPEFQGQVELTGDELTALVFPYEGFTVHTEAGAIVKEAHQLQPADVVEMVRNGVVVKEVVVAADSGVYNQPADEADAAEGDRVNV